MEDKVLGSGTFAAGTWSVSWKSGKLVGAIALSSSYVTGNLDLDLSTKAALDEVKVLIPGAVVAEIVNVVELALGAS